MKNALVAAVLLACTAAPACAAEVDIEVRNVRAATGHVRVAICTEAEFLHPTCMWKEAVPATKGVTRVHFANIPPGTYAAQGYYDQHDWGELRQDFLGFPEEGIGFSNDAPINYAPPHWEAARFSVGDEPVHQFMTMLYFML